MAIVHDFPSIARILNRQVQKAEFEAKQPAAILSVLPRFDLPDLRGRVNQNGTNG